MQSLLGNIDFLQQTFLFGEGISYPIQHHIARHMVLKRYAGHEQFVQDESHCLYMLKQGELQLMSPEKKIIETLKIGEFCGEERLLPDNRARFIVQTTKPSDVYLIQNYPFLEIPIVHWKLLETLAKRSRILDNLTTAAEHPRQK